MSHHPRDPSAAPKPRATARGVGGGSPRKPEWVILPARGLAAALWIVLAGCSPTLPPAHRVVMVGIDGGDWRVLDPFIEQGVAPNLARMRQRGASAWLQVDSAQSPESWTSIASGRHPAEHGVIQINNGQLGGAFGASNEDVKVHRIWDMATRYDRSSLILNFWASSPAYPILGVLIPRERGTSWPPGLESGSPDVVPTKHAQIVGSLGLGALDSGRARDMLALRTFDLAILPYYGLDQALHIFFTEYSTAPNPAAMAALPPADAARTQLGYEVVEETVRLADGWVGLALQAAGSDGYVVLFSDHGHSAAQPPTRRVALGRMALDGESGTIENGTVDLSKLGLGEAHATIVDMTRRQSGVEFRVPALTLAGAGAEAVRTALLARQTASGAPVFAPASDGGLEASPDVVEACRTAVGKHEEPAFSCFINTGSHGVRDLGIFAVLGPDVRPGQLPDAVQSVDITPTVLWLMGLPTGADLAGHPRAEIFSVARPVVTIPTYEDGKMPWRHGVQDAPVDEIRLQEWLKSMGYLD